MSDQTEDETDHQHKEFKMWVRDGGGTEDFISILLQFGFTSKLSLSNLDLDTDDGQVLLSDLNHGQRCLLRGLIELSSAKPKHVYASGLNRISVMKEKYSADSMRVKLNTLFRSNSSTPGPSQALEEFQPRKQKRKGKGKMGGKPAKMKKVKEVCLKVIGLDTSQDTMPIGVQRDQRQKAVWLNDQATEADVKSIIRETFGWSLDCDVGLLYASGRNLRPATLSDVANATSWDYEAVRVLMGSGCLYVCKKESNATSEVNLEDLEKLNEIFSNYPPEQILRVFKEKGFNNTLDYLVDDMKSKLTGIHGSSSGQVFDQLHSPYEESSSRAIQGSISDSFLHQVHSPHEAIEGSSNTIQCYSPTHLEQKDHPGTARHEGSSINPISVPEVKSVGDLLKSHAEKMLRASSYLLSVDRSCSDKLWLSAFTFYKGAVHNPRKVRKELTVTYDMTGEEGADAGALRREFFEDSIREGNHRLLEGHDTRRVFRKDWNLSESYEALGCLVAHSILQGGPGLACLSPCVFDYLSNIRRKCGFSEIFPEKIDIPLNLATEDLVSVIEMLDKAVTESEVDAVTDSSVGSSIINYSGWSIVEPVTRVNKYHLIQSLVYSEVIARRESNMQAFYRGLNILRVGTLLNTYPHLMRDYFVHKENTLTATGFWTLIDAPCERPKNEEEQQALHYFQDFVTYLEDSTHPVSLPSLLRFITGASEVPPTGLEFPIKISYLANDPSSFLPKTQACFSKLNLPVCHNTKESFFSAFTKALIFGQGYGNL